MAALQIIWGVWRNLNTTEYGILCDDVTSIAPENHRDCLAIAGLMIDPRMALVYGPCTREEAEEYVRDMG